MLFFIDIPIEYEFDFKDIYKNALEYFNQKDIFEVSLYCVSNRKIKKLNRETRNIDKVTDVLSYPNLNIKGLPIDIGDYKTDINPETMKLMLGEIVICKNKAEEQADLYGHSYKREFCYLFLHGFLHLLGFDHEDEKDKKEMRGIEEKILKMVKIDKNN